MWWVQPLLLPTVDSQKCPYKPVQFCALGHVPAELGWREEINKFKIQGKKLFMHININVEKYSFLPILPLRFPKANYLPFSQQQLLITSNFIQKVECHKGTLSLIILTQNTTTTDQLKCMQIVINWARWPICGFWTGHEGKLVYISHTHGEF